MKSHWSLAGLLAASVAGFALLAVAYGHAWIVPFDTSVSDWVAGSMPGWAEWIARPFTWLGSLIVLAVVVMSTAAWLALRRRYFDAALVALVLVTGQLVVDGLKDAFDRPRPDAGSAILLPESSSFPSGHAANSLAVLVAVALLLTEGTSTRVRARCLGLALTVAFCVGASRVVLNVHYVSDVAAGYCLGLVLLSAGVLARGAPRARIPVRASAPDRSR